MRCLLDQLSAGAEYALAVFDQQSLRDVLAYGGEVMANHDQRSTFAMPGMQVLPKELLTQFIERGVGFVEEKDGGVGQAQSGE